MNLCIVNEDHPQCNVPRKVIKACPSRGWAVSLALSPSLSLRERPCRPFSPQDFCSPCEFVHCSHNTWISQAGVHITFCQVLLSVGPIESSTCWNYLFGFPELKKEDSLSILPYIQHHLLWMKTSLWCGWWWFISLAPRSHAFYIIEKYPLFIACHNLL